MMGSGKSSIGYLVSKKLNLKFVDIDSKIEEETGMKILNIFSEKGEKFFRNLEEKVTLKILKTNNTVISLGGGAFINDKIRKEILTNHNSFWLNWDLEILLKRIKNSKKRPLVLNSSDQEIKNLIKKRAIIYSKAKFKINCNKLTKSEIVKKIKRIYEHN
jgi:shikimate kinase